MSTNLYVSHPAINNGNEKQMLSFQGLSRKDKISFSRKDGQIFFRKKLSTRFCLTNGRNNIQDYELIRAVMNLPSKCEPFYFRLTKLCQANSSIGLYDEVDIYVGQVAITEMSFNDCQCEVTFKLRPNDCYECIFKGWDLDQNIYQIPTVESKVKPTLYETHDAETWVYDLGLSGGSPFVPRNFNPPLPPVDSFSKILQLKAIDTDLYNNLNYFSYNIDKDLVYQPPSPFLGPGIYIENACPLYWCFQSNNMQLIPGGGTLIINLRTTWHREVNFGPASPSGMGWLPAEETNKWWRCPLTNAPTYGQKYGRKLKDVLSFLENQLQCNLEIRSNFFGINPFNDVSDNILDNKAYQYAKSNMQYLTIHSAYDVKRSGEENPNVASSRYYNLSLKDLLSDLQILFDVYWDCVELENGQRYLRIEHISFYQDSERCALDFTNDKRYSCNKFKYDREKIPHKEDFQYRNNVDASVPFLTTPITYTDVCADPNTSEENTLELFDTDIGAIAANEDFDEEGFVLIANNSTPSNAGPIFEIINSNFELSWPQLITHLHTYYRPLQEGRLNGNDISFTTVKPQRSIEKLERALCCSDYQQFNPQCQAIIQLRPGEEVQGEVDRADWNIFEQNITYNIKG